MSEREDVGIRLLVDESDLGKKIWNAAIEQAARLADKELAGRLAARIRELKK